MVSYGDWKMEVGEVRDKMDRGQLIPDPDWQRGYIWRSKDEQLLIDSILRGIPIPKLYLTQEYDAKKLRSIHYAVDGQQRLKAIYRFLTNKFPIEREGRQYHFKDLDASMQQTIATYELTGHYLRDYTQADITFLFERLNSTGIKLTNMEAWNAKFFETNVLSMLKEIEQEHKDFYVDIIYTGDNIIRKLPLDDILDICNCLEKRSVEGGYKTTLESFLEDNRDISPRNSSKIKSTFRKVINNLAEIFSKGDLEASAYAKRTHFISLFLGMALLIPDYFILVDPDDLKEDLLDFIQEQPEEYRESVLGAIRSRSKRRTRVKLLQKVILKHAEKLDPTRNFPDSMKHKLWRQQGHICQICSKRIRGYTDAVVDHIKPWARGGKTEESNAQLAHKRCNQRKRDNLEPYVIL